MPNFMQIDKSFHENVHWQSTDEWMDEQIGGHTYLKNKIFNDDKYRCGNIFWAVSLIVWLYQYTFLHKNCIVTAYLNPLDKIYNIVKSKYTMYTKYTMDLR